MTLHRYCHLVLVARFPSPGTCKTRLIPRLGEVGAYEFSLASLTDILHLYAKLPVRKTLLYTPTDARPALIQFIQDEKLQSSWEIHPQAPATDLGGRLRVGLGFVKTESWSEEEKSESDPKCRWPLGAVSFIGMDCFDLSPSDILQSMTLVSPTTAYMSPASDGGYVLLTLPLNCSDKVFDGIPWSCEQTGKVQMTRLAEAGLSCTLGVVRDDVDTPQDLEKLWEKRGQKLDRYPRTMEYLKTVMTDRTLKSQS